MKANTGELKLKGFATENFEFEGMAGVVDLEDVHGTTEMDVRNDCQFRVHSLDGSLEINQIDMESSLEIAKNVPFKAVNAGRKCDLRILNNLVSDDTSEDLIELSGMKSSLTIGLLPDEL